LSDPDEEGWEWKESADPDPPQHLWDEVWELLLSLPQDQEARDIALAVVVVGGAVFALWLLVVIALWT
jgi:hypothetical protein